MSTLKMSIQLMDQVTGQSIISAGGVVYVATAGDTTKLTLTDDAGAALSNPVAITNGHIDFNVDVANETVDLYGIAPGGQSFQALGIAPSGPNEIFIDTGRKHQMLVIPFAQSGFTANTETATGFVEPANALMLSSASVRVTAIDATETIDVGTLSTDSGDADGFLALIALGVLGVIKGTIANGTPTLGALLWVQDSANAGDEAPEAHVSGGKSITITSSAGADTGKGFINLPYVLLA